MHNSSWRFFFSPPPQPGNPSGLRLVRFPLSQFASVRPFFPSVAQTRMRARRGISGESEKGLYFVIRIITQSEERVSEGRG